MSLFTTSCYYDVEDELYGTIQCDTPADVSYAVDIVPIINQSCATTACHSSTGSAPGDFGSYDGFKQKVDNGSIQAEVIQNMSMPPSGALNICDIQLIQIWIDQGANNN